MLDDGRHLIKWQVSYLNFNPKRIAQGIKNIRGRDIPKIATHHDWGTKKKTFLCILSEFFLSKSVIFAPDTLAPTPIQKHTAGLSIEAHDHCNTSSCLTSSWKGEGGMDNFWWWKTGEVQFLFFGRSITLQNKGSIAWKTPKIWQLHFTLSVEKLWTKTAHKYLCYIIQQKLKKVLILNVLHYSMVILSYFQK